MCLPHFHPLLIAYFFQTCLIPQKNFRVFTWTGRGIKWPVQRRIRFPLKGVLGVNGALGAPRARVRQKSFNLENLLARTCGTPKAPFTPRIPFKGNCVIDCVFSGGFTWTGYFIEAFSVGGGCIKWPIQHRLCFFRVFTWTGHFIQAFFVGGGYVKKPIQHRSWVSFRSFTWIGHFIEAFSVGGEGIKWSVQHRLCFFQGFYLDWLLYRHILCWGRVYKVASPT